MKDELLIDKNANVKSEQKGTVATLRRFPSLSAFLQEPYPVIAIYFFSSMGFSTCFGTFMISTPFSNLAEISSC